MRLLNSTTLDFKMFNDEELPPYAILSHTWGSDEVGYQEVRYLQRMAALPPNLKQNWACIISLEAAAGLDIGKEGMVPIPCRAGYHKIQHTASIAKRNGLQWFWVDTCCIDKSSSAELQEAINSMYRWYQLSTLCIVFLENATLAGTTQSAQSQFEKMLQQSKWITRGWTLQELIAPRAVTFYDSSWSLILEKRDALEQLRKVTGIPEYVLASGDLSRASVAQKMSWAAARTTSRIEDIAYSLLGIFGVHMPMLYGERENAFLRLQEEIMRRTSDDSIFAWGSAPESSFRGLGTSFSTYRGLLAKSPEEFRYSASVRRGNGTFAISNMGVRIDMDILRNSFKEWDEDLYLGRLNAVSSEDGENIAIVLRQFGEQEYARVACHEFRYWTRNRMQDLSSARLYIPHTPEIPPTFQSRTIKSIHFRNGSAEYWVPTYSIQAMRPTELATVNPPTIIVPREWNQKQHDFQFPLWQDMFLACVKLVNLPDAGREYPQYPPFMLLIGYNITTGRSWCRILEVGSWPDISAPAEFWQAALRHRDPIKDGSSRSATLALGSNDDSRVMKMEVAPKLYKDQLYLMADIDGLSTELTHAL
jgi:hypothetical protein